MANQRFSERTLLDPRVGEFLVREGLLDVAGRGAVHRFADLFMGNLLDVLVTSPAGNLGVNGMSVHLLADEEDPFRLAFQVQPHFRVFMTHEAVFFVDPPLDRSTLDRPCLGDEDRPEKEQDERGRWERFPVFQVNSL